MDGYLVLEQNRQELGVEELLNVLSTIGYYKLSVFLTLNTILGSKKKVATKVFLLLQLSFLSI